MSEIDRLILIFCLPICIVFLCRIISAVDKGKSIKEIFFPKNRHPS